jgi:hypothetical protein
LNSFRALPLALLAACAPRVASPHHYVHIDSPTPVTLSEWQGKGKPFTPLCQSPCDAVIESASPWRLSVREDRWWGSPGISLDGHGPDVTLTVKPAHRDEVIGGVVVTLLAGALVGGGAVLTPYSAMAEAPSASGHRPVSTPLLVGGLGMIGLGLGSFVAGVGTIVHNVTKVDVRDTPRNRSGERSPRYWAGEF